ncbi:MAG: hypothetical protein HY960_04100 [Ignavibacteriae bacterium]|nr:hypothetical protein [Ignavibacteriota bacterium]
MSLQEAKRRGPEGMAHGALNPAFRLTFDSEIASLRSQCLFGERLIKDADMKSAATFLF